MLFYHTEYFPGLYHISDAMGVQFTLIVQKARGKAVLFDAGYGLFDPRPYLAELLKVHGLDLGALTVVVSHAHFDHLPGARWFQSFYIHHDEAPLLARYTQERFRRRVLLQANEKGILPKDFNEAEFLRDAYLNRARPNPPDIPGIEFFVVPGHTPGSLAAYIPQYNVLLTGDDWNPTTWIFFPEALPVMDYAKSMQNLLSLDFEYVLCSHSPNLIPGARLRGYIQGLTAETFAKAVPTETPYPEIKTLLCHPEPETNLVFRAIEREAIH